MEEKRGKVLVTGANGYIGSHVVKKMCDMGIDVIATDIKDDNIDKRAIIVKSNIFDIKDGENSYEKYYQPDVCLHMAWLDGFNHNSPKHMEYLSAHYKFISNLIDNGLKQIAGMGTMHEIGFYEGVANEDIPTVPLTLYGISKNALRKALEVKCKEANVIYQWLRCFYITGDDMKSNSIFGKILRAAAEGKTEFPFTSGVNLFDFIDVNELAEQLSLAVMQDEITGIINCCSGVPMSLGERVEKFIEDNDLNINLVYGAFPDRPGASKANLADPTKINIIKANNKKVLEKIRKY